MTAPSVRTLRSAFATYREAMEEARDPELPRPARDRAWSRAANARRRLEQGLLRLGEMR